MKVLAFMLILVLLIVPVISGCAGITELRSDLQGNAAAERAHRDCLESANRKADESNLKRKRFGEGLLMGLPLIWSTFGASLLVGAIAGAVKGPVDETALQRDYYEECMLNRGFQSQGAGSLKVENQILPR